MTLLGPGEGWEGGTPSSETDYSTTPGRGRRVRERVRPPHFHDFRSDEWDTGRKEKICSDKILCLVEEDKGTGPFVWVQSLILDGRCEPGVQVRREVELKGT